MMISNTLLVGLGFRARSGKDYLARHIRKEIIRRHPTLDAVQLSFAGDLKATARTMFGMAGKNAPLLQTLGTDVFRRHMDEHIWVRNIRAQVGDLSADYELVGEGCVIILPDVRFPNEWRFVGLERGILVRVDRLNADGTPWRSNDRDQTHVSECALDSAEYGWDYHVKAVTGDLDGLKAQAEPIIQHILNWASAKSN